MEKIHRDIEGECCMVKRNAHVVLFVFGQVIEIPLFVWDRQTGITLAVLREIQPYLEKPFFSKVGHHMLRYLFKTVGTHPC